MKEYRLAAGLFFILLITLLLSSPGVQAATITVCSAACDFTSIQTAIAAANPDDIVSIGAGTYSETVVIDKDLTLQGEGTGSTTISTGSGVSSVLSVDSGVTAVIQGVTISGGRKENTGSLLDGGGGGIYNAGNLTLTLSAVTGNVAVGSNSDPDAYGGGIFNCGVMTIIESSISNNSVTGSNIDNLVGGGSALGGLAQGGGIYNINGSLTVIRSTISGNVATGGNAVAGTGGSGQGGRGEGGGIYTWAWGGGGCRPPNAAVYLTNSTVSSNEAKGGTGVSGTAEADMSVGGTGGSAAGGGIYNLGGLSGLDPLSSISLSYTTVANNSATGGDGIDADGPDRNPAGGNGFGGGITSNLLASLANTIVSDNRALGGSATDGGFPLPQFNGSGFGGGLNHGGATFFQTARYSIVTNNEPDECSDPITTQGNNYESYAGCGFTDSSDRQNEPAIGLLDALADNGGPTRTHALGNELPIDYGENSSCPSIDQRGNLRPIDGICDVGAFESGLNSAPVLDPSGDPALAPLKRNAGETEGTLVADIIASVLPLDMITDANALAEEGMAVIGVTSTNGIWQYFDPSDESGWNDIENPAESMPLLLPADDEFRIRFVPNADFCGIVDPGITFRAWDRLGNFDAGSPDTSINGGNTPFSSSIETAEIIVFCNDYFLPLIVK